MTEKNEGGVMLRSMIFGAIIFALLMVLAVWLDDRIAVTFPKFKNETYGGIILFFLWVTVTTTLRRANKANARIDAWRLMLIAVFIAIAGSALGTALNRLYGHQVQEGWAAPELSERSLLFYGGLGLVASVLALINLRIESKFLGNILELIVIAAIIYGFYYFMN